MSMTASQMLKAHKETWDMPTLAERHPEVLKHLDEKYEVHFGMLSEVVVVHKKDGHSEFMTDAEGKPTNDVRVAVETLLKREAESEDQWEFEGPDHEVGIFGTSVVHCCPANTEEEQAEEGTTNTVDDGKFVTVTTAWHCTACGACTATVESFPSEHFADEPDEHQYREDGYLAAGDGSAQRYFTETSL